MFKCSESFNLFRAFNVFNPFNFRRLERSSERVENYSFEVKIETKITKNPSK